MNAEDARAWGQALVASCARFLSHANNVVSTHVLHVRSPTFDATLRDGVGCALLTCVNASMLMCWLPWFDVSYCVHAALWYALVLLTNVSENRLPGRIWWQCMFCVLVIAMSRLDYCHGVYAGFLCCVCFWLRMHGMGLVSIVWQLRVEVHIYIMVLWLIRWTQMAHDKMAAIVRADGMIWNPFTFLWCSAIAFNWDMYTEYNIRISDWTRIVSWKRAFFALTFWRFMWFCAIPKGLYFAYENLYWIYKENTKTVPRAAPAESDDPDPWLWQFYQEVENFTEEVYD